MKLYFFMAHFGLLFLLFMQKGISETAELQTFYEALSPTEQLALTHGKQDYLAYTASATRKNLLCATFTRPSKVVISIVQNNIHTMRGQCDWAIVFHNGLVEQQVPLFDADFFAWYVKRVLVHTLPYSLQYGADWGHDRTWCRAARAYSIFVLGIPISSSHVVCALLTKANPVFHLNLKNMRNKRLYREVFRSNANQVLS
eukprot:gene34829-42179_t